MSDYLSHLIESVESTAEWRRGKAEQYPDDTRNQDAAEWLDRLAKELEELFGSDLDQRLEAIETTIEKNEWWDAHGTEWISESLRSVGFHSSYDGKGFLQAYIDELEDKLESRFEGAAAEYPAVKAAEQLYENAVRVARPAYDEAVAAAQQIFDEAVRPAKLAYEQALAEAKRQFSAQSGH